MLPSDVGSARYTLTQDLPWAGKRDLKREIATQDSQVVSSRVQQTWVDMAARIKALFAQRYLIKATEQLVSENLDLMLQLEKVLQVRYAGGLSAQQDITRIHVEHTGMRAELVALALRTVPETGKLNLYALSERLRLLNPQLTVELARVQFAAKSRDLAYKNRYPDFTVGINAMQRRGAINEWGLMFEMNLPIQRDVLRAQEREFEAMLAAAQSRQEAALNQALADLSDSLIALQAARDTDHLMTFSLMPQADLTWRAALASY